MAQDPTQFTPVFRIDVSADPPKPAGGNVVSPNNVEMSHAMLAFMRRLVQLQEKQNEMLDQILQNSVNAQRQRAQELQQWKDANPRLARACRNAAEALAKIQVQFLETLTEEIAENEETLLDGDFMFHDFVDRYGPRLAHLNGVLQVLTQLGHGNPATAG